MKLEWPMLTSTWPLELFRPMTMRFCRIRYSSSRPSSLAITPVTSWSGAHCTLVGLPGIDLSACSVQSVSDMVPACCTRSTVSADAAATEVCVCVYGVYTALQRAVTAISRRTTIETITRDDDIARYGGGCSFRCCGGVVVVGPGRV